METEWTSEKAPRPGDLPELDAQTLEAVRALQGGEVQESTRHIFEVFEPQLGAYFRRHGCQAEADDLTQSVFIQMLDQIGTLKDATRFHFWLFKIAGNYLRNFRRDQARDREGLEDFAEEARKDSETGAFWARGTFEPNPETRLTVSESVERRRLLLSKLLHATKLAPHTRRSLLLRLHGASYEEIARALEIPAGTARSHVSRASAALLRNLERLEVDDVTPDDTIDEDVADLSPELLTFKREALEADPAYFRAGILEAASADDEAAEERDEDTPAPVAGEEPEDEVGWVARVYDSPAEIAAVARQDRRRGRPRRRTIRTIPPAGDRDEGLVLGRLSRDDLGYPLILLEEAAERCGDRSTGAHADGRLAVKAKLACAEALLARGRRFAIARRAAERVRLAIYLIAHGRRDQIQYRVVEARNLLRSYLDAAARRTAAA
ncbi:MAG: sigma-70 family RNA polymerase sigma factor [bacterium]|nr:sigma-70 family RNA polymerase sigma factor [bacterium]